jgi:thiamine monophosphate kinase
MRVWVILLYGRNERDPLLLQAKEATASVLEKHLHPPARAGHAERVVEGQKLMQQSSDIFLGWSAANAGGHAREREYYVRQAADGKGAIDVSLLLPSGLAAYGRLCGWTLARAHARDGDRIAIAGYLGKSDAFDHSIARFAERYADQNEADYKALQHAVRDGRLTAAKGSTA